MLSELGSSERSRQPQERGTANKGGMSGASEVLGAPEASKALGSPRVAVLGASGIGRFHVRELARAGARVVAVLGSRPESARTTAAALQAAYGVGVEPLHRLEDLLALDLDAVSIATPHELHYEQALACLRAGLGVSCEKPLFWEQGLDAQASEKRLALLEQAGADSRLALNLANVTLFDAVADRTGAPRSFTCRFTTNGPHRGDAIGVDLLPHGLALALRWMGAHAVSVRSVSHASVLSSAGDRVSGRYGFSAVSKRSEEHRFELQARLRGVDLRFVFRQEPRVEKRLELELNGVRYRRVARTTGGAYRVSLQRDPEVDGARELPLVDPFRVHFARFTASLHGRDVPLAGWPLAVAVQRAMVALLVPG